uniref:Uncharacterized protein n=1 Tax=Panstrongylus lignarius TaxID=156445 RepID=A0A224XZR5_9HEMI
MAHAFGLILVLITICCRLHIKLTIICFVLFIANTNLAIKHYKPEYYEQQHIDFFDVGTSLFLVFGLYLLYGVYEETPSFVLAWIIFNWATVFVVLADLMFSSINCIVYRSYPINYYYCGTLLRELISALIACALLTYNGLVVSSLYQSFGMKRGRRIEENNCHHDSLWEE